MKLEMTLPPHPRHTQPLTPETGGPGPGAHGQGKAVDGALQAVDSRPVWRQRDKGPKRHWGIQGTTELELGQGRLWRG